MPSRPSNTNKRASKTADKALQRSPLPDSGNERTTSHKRTRIYTRSDSPGARTYAAVLSSPSPPPPSQRREVNVFDSRRSTWIMERSEATHDSKAADGNEDTESSSVEVVAGPALIQPSTPKRLHKRRPKHRRASTPSTTSDMAVSDVDMTRRPSKSKRWNAKSSKGPARDRSVNAYEADSFVELDDSDTAEIKNAYRDYRAARLASSPAPSNMVSVEDSPSPDSCFKKNKSTASRPRVPSGIKSSPIQTRSSNGIYKRRLQPDAATISEEERALNITPKKARRSAKGSKAASGSRLSPIPLNLPSDTTPLPVFEALHDILHKKTSGDPNISYRVDQIPSSSPEVSPESHSPSLSPEKTSSDKPVSISPLKIDGLAPSPEIPSPEDPRAKKRRHDIFDKTISRSTRHDQFRGRTLERGRRKHSSSASDQEVSSPESDSLPRTPDKKKRRTTHHRRGAEGKVIKHRKDISPDWDTISETELPSTPKRRRKRNASICLRSPSRRRAVDKGKKRATSPHSIHSDITPPPPFKPSKEVMHQEVQELMKVVKASRLAREAELRQAVSDANAGSSQAVDVFNAVPEAIKPSANNEGSVNKMALANGMLTGNEVSKPEIVANASATNTSEAQTMVDASASSTSNGQTVADPVTSDTGKTAKQAIAPNHPWITDYQSVNSISVTSLPATCEVSDSALWDPALAGDYPHLPKLRHGILVSWKGVTAAGLIGFSGWKDQVPSTKSDLLAASVRFAKHKYFLNPSRDSPLNAFVYDASGIGSGAKGVLYAKLKPDPSESKEPEVSTECKQVNEIEESKESTDTTAKLEEKETKAKDAIENRARMAICLSTIFVTESQLTTPSSGGLKNKYIKGPLHTQELERMAAYLSMCFKRNALVAQFDSDQNLSFGTMGSKDAKSNDTSASKSESTATTSSAQSYSHIRSKGLFKAVQPSTHHRFSKSHIKVVLQATDTVPVFNAIGQDFKLPHDIEKFDGLPKHTGEVPLGSCALVGYTVSLYKSSKDQLALATNLQFVIILATN